MCLRAVHDVNDNSVSQTWPVGPPQLFQMSALSNITILGHVDPSNVQSFLLG